MFGFVAEFQEILADVPDVLYATSICCFRRKDCIPSALA
jgi:hypothetical protein